jgi:hypothetical protein
LIELFSCNSKDELTARERFYIDTIPCVNHCLQSKKEWCEANKEAIAEQRKNYYEANKEAVAEQNKTYLQQIKKQF